MGLFDHLFAEEETKKKIRVENNTIYVLDEELRKKIDKVSLSPTMIGSILSSPGDWVMSKFIEPDVTTKKLDHLERGSWFHKVMEHFFSMPEIERTKEGLKMAVKKASQEEDLKHLLEDEENKEWLRVALANYYKVFFETDSKEKIAEIYLNGKTQKGIEVFVSGKIGKASRNCLGFIDRLTEGEKGLKILDWKTGKKVDTFDPTKNISDNNSFEYWRQQTFYSILLKQKGMNIEEASLIFPCANPPTKLYIPFDNEKVIQQTVKDVEQCDSILTECIQNDYTFPLRKGAWNSWASYLCGLGNAPFPKVNQDELDKIVEIVK